MKNSESGSMKETWVQDESGDEMKAVASTDRTAGSLERVKEKGSTLRWVMTGLVFLCYAVFLVLGLIGYYTDLLKNFFLRHSQLSMLLSMGLTTGYKSSSPQREEIFAVFAKLYSLSILVLLPSVLLYIATKAPFRLSRTVKIILFISGIVLLIGFAVLFHMECATRFDVMQPPEGESLLFFKIMWRVSNISGIVLYIVFYIKFGFLDDGVFNWISCIILSLSTIALPLLIFPLSIVVAIIAGIIITMLIFGFISGAFLGPNTSSGGEKKEYSYVDSQGYRRTVYSSDGKDFYNSSGSHVGTSSDGGRTIKED